MTFAPPYARMSALLKSARRQLQQDAAAMAPPPPPLAPKPEPPEPEPPPAPEPEPDLEPAPALVLLSEQDSLPEVPAEKLPFPAYDRQMMNSALVAAARQAGLEVSDEMRRKDLLALLDKAKEEWD